MKGSYRGKRSRFNALRRGAHRNKPQVWLPIAPGAQGSTSNRASNTLQYYANPGSTTENVPDQGWLFAITPEGSGNVQTTQSVFALGGDIDPEQQYRVVGLKGSLHWTPLQSLADPDNAPEAWSGFLSLYWYKLEASRTPTPESSDSPLVYPWSAGWDDEANTTGRTAQSFVPWYETVAVVSGPSTLRNRDPRYRVDVMHHVKVPWTIKMRPVWDNSVSDSVLFFPVEQRPIRIPLPRKLICNVGRGQALACAYQITSQSSVAAASAPVGLFNFQDMKILVHELD